MSRTVDTRTGLDRTVRIFDSFYATDLRVNTNQFDIVHGYFTTVCTTKDIANNFTVMLFRVSQQTGIDAVTLIEELRGKNNTKLQMNEKMAYYLNGLKSKTSLYGVSSIPQPVVPVARNIVQ